MGTLDQGCRRVSRLGIETPLVRSDSRMSPVIGRLCRRLSLRRLALKFLQLPGEQPERLSEQLTLGIGELDLRVQPTQRRCGAMQATPQSHGLLTSNKEQQRQQFRFDRLEARDDFPTLSEQSSSRRRPVRCRARTQTVSIAPAGARDVLSSPPQSRGGSCGFQWPAARAVVPVLVGFLNNPALFADGTPL